MPAPFGPRKPTTSPASIWNEIAVDGAHLAPLAVDEAAQRRAQPGLALRHAEDLRQARDFDDPGHSAPAYAARVRILLVSQMYPGPDAPDLGTFVAQVERALVDRGHEVERAVLDTRAGGKLRYLELARRTLRAQRGPTSSTRTSSSRAG